ncbi:hypothetical protein HY501_01170 [Candidatus Woesearchaeota archaeon]|nr:hypothetical protein [Candidatus Woesearchaeota archaeon]
MATKTFLKVVAAFFSSISVSFGLALIFFALVIGNIDNNVDKIPLVMETTSAAFFEENREEIRAFVDEQLKESGALPEFSIQELRLVCMEDPAALPGDICSDVDLGISAQEARSRMLDVLIDQSSAQLQEDILSGSGLAEIDKALGEVSFLFDAMIFVVIVGLAVYLFGVFLTFVSSSFNVLIATYRIALKTSINLLGIGLIFTYFKTMDASLVIGLARGIAERLGDSFALPGNVPEILVKLVAQIVIDWLALSLSPVRTLAFIVLIPFAVLTGSLLIVRIVRRKKLELLEKKSKKDEKEFIPKDEIA